MSTVAVLASSLVYSGVEVIVHGLSLSMSYCHPCTNIIRSILAFHSRLVTSCHGTNQ